MIKQNQIKESPFTRIKSPLVKSWEKQYGHGFEEFKSGQHMQNHFSTVSEREFGEFEPIQNRSIPSAKDREISRGE